MTEVTRLGVRWTVGDVSDRGFEALRLSIWGACRIFGPAARYAVCVNSMPIDEARARTGPVPPGIDWQVSDGSMPDFLCRHLDEGLAEGVAWKLAPLRLFPELYEISLDNDCILWAMPPSIGRWLTGEGAACLLAEDVALGCGQFAGLCGPAPRNTGIRGLPPMFDLADAMQRILAENPVRLVSELDEQGLQVAAASASCPPEVVTIEEVAICSPSPPHVPSPGNCGAHFVGLNMKRPRPWYDQARLDLIAQFWDARKDAIYAAVGLPPAGDDKHFSRTHWSRSISAGFPSGSA
jgi:hypothetical protein